MQAYITDNKTIELRQVTPEFDKILYDYFAVRHPQYEFINMGGAGMDWDGYYRKYRKHKLSKTFLNELKSFCKSQKVPLSIIDKRKQVIKPKCEITDDMIYGIKLEDYQVSAIKSAIDNETGLIVMPTGSGKTEVMIGITELFKTNTIIFADMQVTIDAIAERYKLRKIGDVGAFYSGTYDKDKQITVCSIHSLIPPKKHLKSYKTRAKHVDDLKEVCKQAEVILVDEADKATNTQWNNLFRYYFKGSRRYGFTATPWEQTKPVENLQLKENIGTEIYKFTDIKKLEELRRVIPIRSFVITIGEDNLNGIKDKMRLNEAEKDFIINNKELHNIIKGLVNNVSGRFLIIVDTIEIKTIGHKLSDLLNAPFLYGQTSRKKRNEVKEKFENGEIKTLIGSKIFKRSLDLKGGTENLIIIGGGKQISNYEQILGRAMRVNERGYAAVFSFFHYTNYYLYKHSRIQLKSIVDRGYKVTVKSKIQSTSGEQFIKSRYRFRKNK